MAKKQQPPNPVEQLQSYFDRWDNLYENGGSDPFYADGSGLNMLRNQIVYGKEAIEKAYSNGDFPEIYHRETPLEVSQDFMVNADGIRLAAGVAMGAYRQDENLQFLIDHSDALPPKIAKHLCTAAVIGYATGLESAIAQDDLITMRRHKTHDHYLKSFKSCADGIRKFQLAETAPLAEKIISKPIQIREKKEQKQPDTPAATAEEIEPEDEPVEEEAQGMSMSM